MTEPEQRYQLLTRDEVLFLSTFEERLERWQIVKDVIRRYYGERARFVTITKAHPDDVVFFHFDVEDEQRQECPVDRASYEVRAYIDEVGLVNARYDVEYAELAEIQWERINSALHTYIQFDERVPKPMPRVPDTYDLLKPPILQARYPELYTLNRETQQYERLRFGQAKQWSQMHHAHELWLRIHSIIPKYYGGHARFVSVTAQREYETEICSIEGIGVTGKQDDQVLWPDITLPWYEEWRKEQSEGWAQRQLSQMAAEDVLRNGYYYGQIEAQIIKEIGFPMMDARYDVQNPPLMPRHPDIYRPTDTPFLPEGDEPSVKQ